MGHRGVAGQLFTAAGRRHEPAVLWLDPRPPEARRGVADVERPAGCLVLRPRREDPAQHCQFTAFWPGPLRTSQSWELTGRVNLPLMGIAISYAPSMVR